MTDIKLKLSEIFYSLQGESSYSGLPCIFIRFAECNLNCNYCDTRYAHDIREQLSLAEIFGIIKEYPCKLVELTGGEPVLQDNILPLMELLHSHGYQILLETNGSLFLGDIPSHVIKIIDVKTPGSGEGDSFMKWNLRCLEPHDELKFVLTSFYDYKFALDFIKENKLESSKILFSPLTNVLSPRLLAGWMLKDGLHARLQLQLHKLISIQ
ncbi:MAG: radical SAM protein [Candidatus Cloacimonetes bacterium]|nr:radical SAM protein [Candidatus Cloacimonadota bacterium]